MKYVTRFLAAAAVLTLALAGCSQAPVSSTNSAPPSNRTTTRSGLPTAPSSAPSGMTSCTYTPTGNPARPVDPPSQSPVAATGTVSAVITTNQGPITITMDRARTPCTIHSFESLVQQGFYDNTKCHRLVDFGIFVLQCGDPTGTGLGGPGYVFPNEVYAGDTYPAGTVAMANAGPNTNGSQFFLVYQDSQLPPNYTVFGRMDEASIGVVARIAVEGQDGSNPDGSGRPNNLAQIVSVTLG